MKPKAGNKGAQQASGGTYVNQASEAQVKLGERGSRIKGLADKTTQMQNSASAFADAARQLRESQ
jgi:hypothetical protein